MTITISSREFNQDTGRAKQAAKHGPVFITDRGRPAHVLLSIEEFERLSSPPVRETRVSLAELLSDPASAHIDFDPPRMFMGFPRAADFD